MKKLAVQDYEDLLQCSIPAFEDLLDEQHNKQLMRLLYQTAQWHALAKSRMHTDTTLEHLCCLTKEFGHLMWQFRDQTCSQFNTVELPYEVAAWSRDQRGQTKISLKHLTYNAPAGPLSTSSHKLRKLNLLTTKSHFLGDYVQTIQHFGCTDSFSTQIVWHPSLPLQKIQMLMPVLNRESRLITWWSGCMGELISAMWQCRLDGTFDK